MATIAVLMFFCLLLCCLYVMRGKIRSFLAPFRDPGFLSVVLGANLAAVLYLALSRQVYFWDNAGYWESAAAMSKLAFSHPWQFVKELAESIYASDYNYMPAVLPALAMAAFGAGRLVFVLSIVNFYFVPFLCLLYKAAKDFTGFLAAVFCLPMVFYLALLGFLDVGGVFLAAAALYIFLFCKADPKIDFCGGTALCLLVLFRRWYVFFAAGFVLCAVAYALVLRGEKLKKAAFTLLGFLAPLFAFFFGYVTNRLLGRNYADIYSAYKFSFGADVRIFLRYFGILPLLAMAGYAVYILAAKKREKLAQTIFLCALAPAIFAMFVMVQTHGQQHLLLYAPAFALLLANFAGSSKRAKAIAAAVAALCSAGIFLPFAQPQSLGEISSYAPIPSFSVYPAVREDAKALADLALYVENLEGDVAVLASSFVLNADIIAKTKASLDCFMPLERSKNIAYLPEVDKRDGKPYNIVYVSYIVLALPIQTHLNPDEQRAVAVPARMLSSDTPFAKAFEKMDVSFGLKDGVTAYVYRRTRPNTEEEMGEMWNAIDSP
ncbi:MAG: hypothetical protein FWG34_13235 [Oscillospiraceae bacterium]|nr:hypothetical protein [Oscillospiraceae bacterium]